MNRLKTYSSNLFSDIFIYIINYKEGRTYILQAVKIFTKVYNKEKAGFFRIFKWIKTQIWRLHSFSSKTFSKNLFRNICLTNQW